MKNKSSRLQKPQKVITPTKMFKFGFAGDTADTATLNDKWEKVLWEKSQ
ncbi:MAG: hypothetical protein CM15mV137_190 [uncultured marine virus]|nr:MAG: hypothetical protein CM15mV137_190 [uncultured marine virus]